MAQPPTKPTGNAGAPTSAQVMTASASTKPVATGTPVKTAATGGINPSNAARATAQPVKAPSFKIESATTRARYLKFMAYGEHGTGKTWLLSTAAAVPAMQDVIMIAAESGDLTLATEDGDYGFDNIDTIKCTNFKQVSDIFEFLKAHCQHRDAGNTEELRKLEAALRGCTPEEITTPKQYRTVIVDSLSEIDVYCLNSLLGITDRTKIDADQANAEWGEYRKNNDMMRRFIRNFRDLPMHVMFTAGRNSVQDDQKRFIYAPALTGKLAMQAQGFVDLVGYLTVLPPDDKGKINRRLWVQPAGKFGAKCRFSNFKGNYFDNPTIKEILDKVGLLAPNVGN